MTEPQRPWWKRKRWIAAAALSILLAYPLSFAPACWVLMRMNLRSQPAEWRLIVRVYQPFVLGLSACPDAASDAVIRAVNSGRTERAALVKGSGRLGILKRDRDEQGRYVIVVYSF